MADFEGEWDCVTDTPMGEQKSVFTINLTDNGFTGCQAGPLGSLDVIDGRIEGDALIWKMLLKKPLAMTLNCRATVDGDQLEGGVTAGAFGTWRMAGVRKI
jgi:hypothetical protein